MRGDNGLSRGFGFVSYQLPDQASSALQNMNSQTIRGKQIQVRFHEPKQLRQEKLAARFADGASTGARRTSGRSSPAISDLGDVASPYNDRVRRGSGSYYNVSITTSPQAVPGLMHYLRPRSPGISIFPGLWRSFSHCLLLSAKMYSKASFSGRYEPSRLSRCCTSTASSSTS